MNLVFLIIVGVLIAVGYAIGDEGTASIVGSAATPPITPPVAPPKADTTPVSTTASTKWNFYASDGSLTGGAITNDPSTWPGDDKVYNICAAIALAEGYNQGVGTAPYDLNNPGDLSPGDESGYPTCATAQVHGGSAIIVFCTAEDGWLALHQKFENIINGDSEVYGDDWTWSQVAAVYAGNSAAWLSNVTSYLGVDPTTTPADYVNS